MKKLLLAFLLLTLVLLITSCLKEDVQPEDVSDTGEETVEGYDIGEIEDINIDELDELGDMEIPDDL